MSNRFEIFGENGKWLVKDNEQMPQLLDLYKCHIRMNEFVDKIADLEAKLAESETHHKWVIEFLEKYKIEPDPAPEYSENPIIEYCKQVDDFRWCDEEENKQLKQQLTKKDEEIEVHGNVIKRLLKNCGNANCEIKRTFAIEKLEKVKHYAQHIQGGLIDYIDNQIKEIKGE